MPIFQSPNSFSKKFNSKSPLAKVGPIELPVDTEEPELQKADFSETDISKKQDKKNKRKATLGKVKAKADEIGQSLLDAPTQTDQYL